MNDRKLPLLDFPRAITWLQMNRSRKISLHFDSEGPYSFLLTFLPQLGWPKQDPRWEKGQSAALAFLSYEADYGNYLLRRSVPSRIPLLSISQTSFDPETRAHIEESRRTNKPFPFHVSITADWLRGSTEGIKGALSGVTGLPIVGESPVLPKGEVTLWGVLLFFERWAQDYPFEGLGQAFSRFMASYMNPARLRHK